MGRWRGRRDGAEDEAGSPGGKKGAQGAGSPGGVGDRESAGGGWEENRAGGG